MSFASQTNVMAGNIVYDLLKFTKNSMAYTYTSGSRERVFDGNIYSPDYSIEVSPIKNDLEKGTADLELTVPSTHPIVQMFKTFVPSGDIKLTLMMTNEAEPESALVTWVGFVVSGGFTWENDADGVPTKYAKLNCASRASILYRMGLSYRFGSSCQHTVYRGGCNLSLEEHELIITADSIDGRLLSSPLISAEDPDRFPAGMAKFGDFQWRDIIAQDGPVITLNIPFEGLALGDTVKLYTGCNRSEARCIELDNFENIFIFNIPNKNIFVTGLN